MLEPAIVDVLAELALESARTGRRLEVPALGLLLQPRVTPADWTAVAERHGLTQGTMFVKCFGPAEPRTVETDRFRAIAD